MKILVISGNPGKQEEFIRNLLVKAAEDGQIVHLHNCLHAEMGLCIKANNYDFKSAGSEENGIAVNNGELTDSLLALYGSSFVGMTYGYSYKYHSTYLSSSPLKLIELVEMTHKFGLNPNSIFKALASVKDIKYVDLFVMYNVVDISAINTALYKYSRCYTNAGSTKYWVDFTDNTSPFNRIETIDITDIAKKTNIIKIDNSSFSLLSNVIDSIVKGEEKPSWAIHPSIEEKEEEHEEDKEEKSYFTRGMIEELVTELNSRTTTNTFIVN